jgi:NADH:ubiquinone oxidoreductase subunit E
MLLLTAHLIRGVFSCLKNAQCKKRFLVTSNLRYIHEVLNVDKIKKKLIAQFGYTLRDEHFEPN